MFVLAVFCAVFVASARGDSSADLYVQNILEEEAVYGQGLQFIATRGFSFEVTPVGAMKQTVKANITNVFVYNLNRLESRKLCSLEFKYNEAAVSCGVSLQPIKMVSYATVKIDHSGNPARNVTFKSTVGSGSYVQVGFRGAPGLIATSVRVKIAKLSTKTEVTSEAGLPLRGEGKKAFFKLFEENLGAQLGEIISRKYKPALEEAAGFVRLPWKR